jgi:hypothetical protein
MARLMSSRPAASTPPGPRADIGRSDLAASAESAGAVFGHIPRLALLGGLQPPPQPSADHRQPQTAHPLTRQRQAAVPSSVAVTDRTRHLCVYDREKPKTANDFLRGIVSAGASEPPGPPSIAPRAARRSGPRGRRHHDGRDRLAGNSWPNMRPIRSSPRIYARVAEIGERRGGAEHHRKLLTDLRGQVVEVGAGSGANFAHYPASAKSSPSSQRATCASVLSVPQPKRRSPYL